MVFCITTLITTIFHSLHEIIFHTELLNFVQFYKMTEEGRVHPDCRNASNPYHECTDYCFKIIAEAKDRMSKIDTGRS